MVKKGTTLKDILNQYYTQKTDLFWLPNYNNDNNRISSWLLIEILLSE